MSRDEGMRVTDDRHYDVIIIGTGAGGGTLAHRLAPTGKRVLLFERGDYLPRERDNWDSTAVFVKGKYRAPEFWYDKHGDEFPPEVNYYVGGNTKFYGAALFRLRPAGLRRASPPRRHLPGVADRSTTTWSRTTRRPSTSTWCTAATARTPPRGRPAPSTRTRRCSTSHASSSSATTWRSRACTRSTCRSGST